MSENHELVVAVFDTHEEAEQAVKNLQKTGFDMRDLSVVAKNPHAEEHVVGFYNTGDRMKAWGASGAFWGAIWSLLFGTAFFAIPGIGPLLVAGPLVAAMVGALESAVVVGGVSAIGAGLFSIGIPKDSVLEYELALKVDKYLVVARGTAAETARAQALMAELRPVVLHAHRLPLGNIR